MTFRILSVLFYLLLPALAQQSQSLLKHSDRVVFVGDSITGQGANAEKGWVHLIRQAFKSAHPGAEPTFVALGGSGHTVGSWQSIEKQSRETATILDVKKVDVRMELGKPADVVVCMLGMNDVLCPRTGNDPASIAAWISRYRALIHALRNRVQPRVFALATPTMCTEDPASPKNLTLRRFAKAMEDLAKEENCVILPTWETMKMVLDFGRTHHPDFHVTGDYVHPNAAGHVAIAVGMLRGLDEPLAARSLLDPLVEQFPATPTLSYQLSPVDTETFAKTTRFKISFHHRQDSTAAPETVSLEVPRGWSVEPANIVASSGTFLVEGPPHHLVNRLILKAGGQKTEVRIPAPWLLGFCAGIPQGWQGSDFIPAKGQLAVDADLARGRGWGSPLEATPGNPLIWKQSIAHRNYVDANKPGAVDFAAVSYCDNFSVGYGARWIAAPTPKTIQVRVRPLGFTSDHHLTLWLNGHEVFLGNPREESPFIPLSLNKGWNVLAFKSNQHSWQWQFDIELTPTPGQSLNDLRFHAHPPESP
ncbi:GDSL-type esterase/lipase family protein [Verrucomicrobiaceae bacterium 227]